jgi:hypothetical protein
MVEFIEEDEMVKEELKFFEAEFEKEDIVDMNFLH